MSGREKSAWVHNFLADAPRDFTQGSKIQEKEVWRFEITKKTFTLPIPGTARPYILHLTPKCRIKNENFDHLIFHCGLGLVQPLLALEWRQKLPMCSNIWLV